MPTAASNDTEVIRPPPVGSICPMVAMVDQERCTGCGICIDACLEQAISVDQLAVVHPGRCIGCGTCIPECPNEALSLGQQAAAVARGAAG